MGNEQKDINNYAFGCAGGTTETHTFAHKIDINWRKMGGKTQVESALERFGRLVWKQSVPESRFRAFRVQIFEVLTPLGRFGEPF